MDLSELKKLQEKVYKLRIDQYPGITIENMYKRLYEIELDILKLMDKADNSPDTAEIWNKYQSIDFETFKKWLENEEA